MFALTFGVLPASAAVPGPALSIKAVAGPTVFSPAHNGSGLPDTYTLRVTNTGSKPTDGSPIVIVDELPRGLTPTGLHGYLEEPNLGEVKPLSCETATATCKYNAPLQPGERLGEVVELTVAPGTVGPVTNSVLVSGGGAPSASANVATAIGTAAESVAEPFGLAAVSAEATGLDGLTDAQAGDHPYETTVSFSLNTADGTRYHVRYESAGGLDGLAAHTKDVVVDVPPGFAGDPSVVEKCPQYDVTAEVCPPNTQIGFARLTIEGRPFSTGESTGAPFYPVYNVAPDKGYPAEFVILISTACRVCAVVCERHA